MIIAGTGHRPDEIGGYTNDAYLKIVKIAYDFLKKNYAEIDVVISGGAQGWDMALADAARRLRIPYLMAIPFVGQEKVWPEIGTYSQEFYNNLKTEAHEIHIICKGGYEPYKMQVRNEWMVNNADMILAMWNGEKSGGTFNCIEYAEKKKKKIINLWEKYESSCIRK